MEVGWRCDASDLCFELAGGNRTAYAHFYGPKPLDRVLERTNRFSLLADLSPLMVGHCLLVPQLHYLSFGEVAMNEPTLEAIFKGMVSRYEAVFGSVAVLEHGSSTDLRGSACISHAHLHFLPMAHHLLLVEMAADGVKMDLTHRWDGLSEFARRDEPYFMLATRSETFIAHIDSPRPKQYLRRVVARILGVEETLSDWALVAFPQFLLQTIELWNEEGD